MLDLIFFVSLSTIRKFLVLLALSYLIILFQVIPDWVNEVLPSSLHHTCMNQKTKIPWFDTQLETRENLPFRFSGYKPIIINPIKRLNSLNYLHSRGEAAEVSQKVHIKCSAFAKKKKNSSYITLRIISDFILWEMWSKPFPFVSI